MEQKQQKAALSIYFEPSNLIGAQYDIKIYYSTEPKDRAEMLDSLSTHLNHVVNALAAMLNTAIRDYSLVKSTVFNDTIHYVTRMRDDIFGIIEFEPPIVNGRKARAPETTEIRILFDPYKPRESQYEMIHETYLEKPRTKDEVLEVLLSDTAHLTNGLVYMLNMVCLDFAQNRADVYNQALHQLLLIKGFGLELTKEMPPPDFRSK